MAAVPYVANCLHRMELRLRQVVMMIAQLCSISGSQRRQAFLDEARVQASQQGYAVLEVNSGLIDMLLIKRQTRVVVMTHSREWLAGDHTRLVMDLLQADAAWVLDWSGPASSEGTGALASQGLIKTIERARPIADKTPVVALRTVEPYSP